MTQVIVNGEKVCTKCAISKPLSDYYARKNKPAHRAYGYTSACKVCLSAYERSYSKANLAKKAETARRWRERNPEKWLEVSRRYRSNNAEIMGERTAKWRSANAEYCKELSRTWAKNNPSKMAAQASKRRAKLLNATPVWADFKAIQIEYDLADWCSKATGIKYHVDHIVPLQGKNVCGLHVPNNLQVIPATDNLKKNNKFIAI